MNKIFSKNTYLSVVIVVFFCFLSISIVFASDPAPTISSISPSSGTPIGGTSVTITGTNFTSGADAYTKLLLHSDGTGAGFTDSSPSAKTVTANGNATQSATQSKFGGKSAYFAGSGDYLTVASSSDWNYGSGDFTIDFWVNLGNLDSDRGMVYQKVDANNEMYIYFNKSSSQGLIAYWYEGSYQFNLRQMSLSGWVANTWHHVALVRSGSSITTYRDGVLLNTASISGSLSGLYTADLEIGNKATAGASYIDELRISKGIARWTSDFTTPTSAYGQLIGVTLGGTSATDISLVNSTSITATTPAHSLGVVDVVVTNSDGQSATSTNGFTYGYGVGVMVGSLFAMDFDSINFAGAVSTTTTYYLEDTMGEVATGYSSSTLYDLHAGFLQNSSSFISISVDTDNVIMSPSLGGITGGYSDGAVITSVVTDNVAGYSLYIQAEGSPALNSSNDSISDYLPAGASPDYDFSVTNTQSSFGFSPNGNDINSRYKNNGSSACNTGTTITSLKCWDGLSTSQKIVAGSTSRNDPQGSNTTINFKVGIGSSKAQKEGWYYATTTLTVVAL